MSVDTKLGIMLYDVKTKHNYKKGIFSIRNHAILNDLVGSYTISTLYHICSTFSSPLLLALPFQGQRFKAPLWGFFSLLYLK